MPREQYDRMLMRSFDDGYFKPKNQRETDAIQECRERVLAQRRELSTHQGEGLRNNCELKAL